MQATRIEEPEHFTMSFGDHLEDLRKRLLFALIPPVPLSIVFFALADYFIEWLSLPVARAMAAEGLPLQLQSLGPAEVVLTRIKLAIIASLIVSLPWILWQTWLFIRPGLYTHERRFVYLLIPGSALLTIIGVCLLYFVMLPLMLQVLVSIGNALRNPMHDAQWNHPYVAEMLKDGLELRVLARDPEAPQPGEAWVVWPQFNQVKIAVPASAPTPIAPDAAPDALPPAVTVLSLQPLDQPMVSQNYRLAEYLSFVLMLMLGTVVAFQTPLVVMLLGWLGLATPDWLRKRRRWALFICAIASAMITPTTDIVSMMIMLVPIYGLFELGIILLVIAPAHKVAAGEVVRRKASDKPRPPAENPAEPAQIIRPATNTAARGEATIPRTDANEGDP